MSQTIPCSCALTNVLLMWNSQKNGSAEQNLSLSNTFPAISASESKRTVLAILSSLAAVCRGHSRHQGYHELHAHDGLASRELTIYALCKHRHLAE